LFIKLLYNLVYKALFSIKSTFWNNFLKLFFDYLIKDIKNDLHLSKNNFCQKLGFKIIHAYWLFLKLWQFITLSTFKMK
jgi:hypothetical protein